MEVAVPLWEKGERTQDRMITVENLTKYFGSVPAVQEVSFVIERGEVAGLVGPNGSGKTTIMRILSGYFPPTSGRTYIGGYDVVKDSIKVRRKIGYFLERVPLYSEMSVYAFLKFMASIKGSASRDIRAKVEEAMEACSIKSVAERPIRHLSKGYRQRVGIAQALLNDPEVIILDEPTVGLDPEQVIEIRNLIKHLKGERTVLLSTHILQEVSLICSRVIIIAEGKVVAADTIDNLMDKVSASNRILLRIEGPREDIIRKLRQIPGVLDVYETEPISGNILEYVLEVNKDGDKDISRDLSMLISTNQWILKEMQVSKVNIEEIFLKSISDSLKK